MIRCIIIDDEPLALQQMEVFLKKISYMELVASCQSAEDARMLLEKEKIDVMFCDINLPELNGLEFVKSLLSRSKGSFGSKRTHVHLVDNPLPLGTFPCCEVNIIYIIGRIAV